jgi:hypothetical protein
VVGTARDRRDGGSQPLQRDQGKPRCLEIAHGLKTRLLVDRCTSPGEAFVVTTASTTAHVEAILWRYIGNAHRKAGLPGRITLDAKWYIGQELVAYGRKPANYDQAAFQAIHARYVLVIIGEAGGVPKSIFDAVDALATNIEARLSPSATRMIPPPTSPPSASRDRGGQ